MPRRMFDTLKRRITNQKQKENVIRLIGVWVSNHTVWRNQMNEMIVNPRSPFPFFTAKKKWNENKIRSFCGLNRYRIDVVLNLLQHLAGDIFWPLIAIHSEIFIVNIVLLVTMIVQIRHGRIQFHTIANIDTGIV